MPGLTLGQRVHLTARAQLQLVSTGADHVESARKRVDETPMPLQDKVVSLIKFTSENNIH